MTSPEVLAIPDTGAEENYSHFSPKEILDAKIRTKRVEAIPLSRVITEDAIIDGEHADELASSMAGEFGQLTPIGVAARYDNEGEIVYDIFDGFHRTDGKKRRREESIAATVVYGLTVEELYDLRILAASSVRSVQFARLAEWITKIYALTPWAQKGLTVAQAFGIAVSDSKRSRNADLAANELQELKAWAIEKCRKWGKPLASTYQTLRIVEDADPELVRQVRAAGGLKDHAGRITQDRLAAVAGVFPVQTHRAAQRSVLRYAVERRLYAEAVPHFAQKISAIITPNMSEEEIYQLLSRITDQDLARLIREDIQETSIINDWGEEKGGGELSSAQEELKNFAAAQEEAASASTQDLLEIDDNLIPSSDDKLSPGRNNGRIRGMTTSKGGDGYHGTLAAKTDDSAYKGLLDENFALKAALRAIRGEESIVDINLLISASALSRIEGEVIRRLFKEFQDLSTVSREMRLQENRIILLFQSALRRNQLENKPDVTIPKDLTRASAEEVAENDPTSNW